MSNRRQDSDRIPLEMCLEINVYSFIYKNKQWTVVYRKQNINLLGDICDNLLYKVGQVFVFMPPPFEEWWRGIIK